MKEAFKVLLKMVLVIVAPIVLLAVVLFCVVFSDFVDSWKPTHRQLELISSDANSKLYIRTENWGVTGSSQLTIITTEGNVKFEPDSTRQIIFSGLEPFMYKQSNDTLILRVRKRARVPKDFKSTWTIVQEEIDDNQMDDLRRDYQYKGI